MSYIERLFIDADGRLSADNPLPADLMSGEDRAALEARNAGIRQAMADIEAYKEAMRRGDGSVPDLSEPMQALDRLRAGEYADPAEGPPDVTAEADRALVDATWNTPLDIHIGPQGDAVNAERERRILAGTAVPVLGIGEIPVQGRDEDTRNLQGLGMAALARLMVGDSGTVTAFRDASNVMHNLTPPQVLDLWRKSAAYVEQVYQASWTIKAMTPIPVDFADDSYWP